MNETGDHMNPVRVAIALLSAAVIAFQIALMQLFSVMQWYHFAHLIISLALLGFGISGTVLALARRKIMKHFSGLFPLLLFLSAISMATMPALAGLKPFRFDAYLLFSSFRDIARLLFSCFFLMLPFFFAGLAIGMSFIRFAAEVGRVYFANLLGSGIGGVLALVLMWIAPPSHLPPLIALLPLAAGIGTGRWQSPVKTVAVISLALIVLMNLIAPPPARSQYKSIQKALLLPEARVVFKKSSPFGLTEVVRSPALRYAPGLSLSYTDSVPPRDILFQNGDWSGAILPAPNDSSKTILSYSAAALPYAVGQPGNVLVLNSGAGENVAMAKSYGATLIDAVEPNPVISRALKRDFAPETDSLFFAPEVRIHRSEARSFLRKAPAAYDLIVLPTVGSFFGTSGLDAFAIRNELTLEAFGSMWHRLKQDGMISVNCWMDYPPKMPLKVLATLMALMNNQGVPEPEQHIAAVRSWSAVSFVVKRSAFTQEEVSHIREFCTRLSFDPLLLPGTEKFDRETDNEVNDSSLFEAFDSLLSDRSADFIKGYPFKIGVSTDDRPYFSQFIRLSSIPRLAELFGSRSVPYLELGYIVVLLAFLILLAASFVLILLPVILIGHRMAEKSRTFIYFCCLGLAYLSMEMGLIQQFTLFLGEAVSSATAVIGILLVSSGLGSYFSERLKPVSRSMGMVCLAASAVLLLYAFLVVPGLLGLLKLPVWIRLFTMIILVGLPGFLAGIPFPLGLTRLSGKSPQAVPWAWAVNGFASVTGTSLAIILSVEAGFSWVLFGAALAYGFAALTNR